MPQADSFVLGTEYRPQQMTALGLLRTGSILCGGVGSGKSRVALGYFFVRVCRGELKINGVGRNAAPKSPRDLYVITTAKKRDEGEWFEESAPFGFERWGLQMTVDSWNNISKYIDVEGAFFIFDEQRLVGSGAWVKSFYKIAEKNDWILLSATPGDVWMDYCPVFVANGFYKNKTEFVREHVIFSRFARYPKIERYIGEARLERYRKQLLVEMPVQRHTRRIRRVEKFRYDVDTYTRVVKTRQDPWTGEPLRTAAILCGTLRRVVAQTGGRVDRVRDLLDRHERLIVFYNYNYELDELRAGLEGEVVREWNGHRHDKIPDTGRWVYLVQYSAGAEGWNCITTDAMVMYSLNYSYRITEQAEGRIDRLNTPYRELYYYYFESDSGIDRGVRKALDSKKVFNEKAFLKEVDND